MTDYYCKDCEFLNDKSKGNFIDGYCKKYNQSLTFYDWFEKCDNCVIENLQEENAELRARLEKAVELPCRIGDTVYEIYDKCNGNSCPYNGYYGQWRCSYEGKKRCNPFIKVRSFCYNNIPHINKTVFVLREAAEARLAELKGESHETTN